MTDDYADELGNDNRFVTRQMTGYELQCWQLMMTGNVIAGLNFLKSRLKPELKESVDIDSLESSEIIKLQTECTRALRVATRVHAPELEMLSQMLREEIAATNATMAPVQPQMTAEQAADAFTQQVLEQLGKAGFARADGGDLQIKLLRAALECDRCHKQMNHATNADRTNTACDHPLQVPAAPCIGTLRPVDVPARVDDVLYECDVCKRMVASNGKARITPQRCEHYSCQGRLLKFSAGGDSHAASNR